MSNRQNTPGPWYATGIHVQSAVINEDNYVCKAEGITSRQAIENARLIATAPELLSALEWLLDEYLTGMDRGDGVEENEAVTEAERVIAKAKGE